MDRLNRIRGEAGTSRDSTLDSTSPPSEAYMTANDSSSKYFSLSEVDSTFGISPIKDVSLTTTADPERTVTDTPPLIPELSPIGKKSDLLDSYKIGKQIEAANILSGGIAIFEDNDNSYDGNELVIDDNVGGDSDKSNSELKLTDNSVLPFHKGEELENTLADTDVDIPSKDTEVVLLVDGKTMHAIDIGNGLYLYRKEGEEELAAVQIVNDDDDQQPTFKFLKVRENTEGNLEVYEEIEIEVPKEVPTKEAKPENNTSHVPIQEINKIISDPINNKVVERKGKSPQKATLITSSIEVDDKKTPESKTEVNVNGRTMKFSELRKSPVIGTFTPMTYHSTPNKEGIPLTKTMVDQQLHPNRHSDNVKKTIEVHTDNCKQKILEAPKTSKDSFNENESVEPTSCQKDKEVSSKQNIDEVKQETEGSKEFNNSNEESKTEIKSLEQPSEKLDNVDELLIKKTDEKKKENNILKVLGSDKNKASDNLNKEFKITPNITANDVEKDISTDNCNMLNVEKLSQPNTPIIEKTSTCRTEIPDSIEKLTNEEKPSNIGNNNVKSLKDNDGEVSSKNFGDKLYKEKVQKEKIDITTEISETTNLKSQESDMIHNKDIASSDTVNDDKPKFLLSSEETVQEDETQKIKQPSDSETQDNKTIKNHNIETSDSSKESSIQKIDSFEDKQPKAAAILLEKPSSELENSNQHLDSVIATELELKKSDSTIETIKDKETEDTDKKVISEKLIITSVVESATGSKIIENKDIPKGNTNLDIKAKLVNNNTAAVPFGKWTEANRQEFLNKIKESKVPINSSNANQIKQPNDLNRRDVLKKIDSQRQSNMASAQAKAHAQETSSLNKLCIKNETSTFSNTKESKIPVKAEASGLKVKQLTNKKPESKPKSELTQKPEIKQASTVKNVPNIHVTSVASAPKKEAVQRKDINNQDLIDKTIEGILNRPLSSKLQDDKGVSAFSINYQSKHQNPQTLDAIEMKMNELHGIPFVERPPHELPCIYNNDRKSCTKAENQKISVNKLPNLLPLTNKVPTKTVKDNMDIDSEEEIIEHEPITGDINLNIKSMPLKLPGKEKLLVSEAINASVSHTAPKRETIITEKDFDKFARRNSITYENCLTVSFDGKQPHNVVQTVVEKEVATRNYSYNDIIPESKATSPEKHKIIVKTNQPIKTQSTAKFLSVNEDALNKNYQSKLQIAYQSALTAKRQMGNPMTIIEDKPVKVVYMDPNSEIIPIELNVQGYELSPKRTQAGTDGLTLSTGDSTDSDILDAIDEVKLQDGAKIKTKHQRKQVLTPVDTPELELIEPSDLGIQVSPKKKRKSDDIKADKHIRNLVPKKTYLLGRRTDEKTIKPQEISKNPLTETINRNDAVPVHKDTVSAIDNLVKAAELLETQSENMTKDISSVQSHNTPQNTPIKRGRGRPRKYPRPEEGLQQTNKTPSPQKKPRLAEMKAAKHETSTDEDSSDEEIVKENWTMGKINENIVCPICNKLFRSENVVFKHVRHCTGPSPNRSDSEKSPRRHDSNKRRDSNKSGDDEIETDQTDQKEEFSRKRKSKDYKPNVANDKIVSMKYTSLENISGKSEETNTHQSRKTITKTKIQYRTSNYVCEFCGKTFRQLSYLDNHKLQHKKDIKKSEHDSQTDKSVFSCEVCKKEFRKLHHLVQHRIIHNQIQSRASRKSSYEQSDRTHKQDAKPNEDQSAGFRCEPCDKSFRKLHHLVEHRETHDGINRQKNPSTNQTLIEKPVPPPQCEICKKIFRKLHHLIEHKEQHLETSSEKSDDKSVKSSLSTKDIIHECPLCYMVFPNEHSLTKHTTICKKKKKQAAAKQAKQVEDAEAVSEGKEENNEANDTVELKDNKSEGDDSVQVIVEEKVECEHPIEIITEKKEITSNIQTQNAEKAAPTDIAIKPQKEIEVKQSSPAKRDIAEVEKSENTSIEIPIKIKKVDENDKDVSKVIETPKKKVVAKDTKVKVGTADFRRPKIVNVQIPATEKINNSTESSDEDDVRYMLNPDFKLEDSTEGQLFMKVRAKKRNSLQIERPNAKDLIKRRTSIQHPLRHSLPRLKSRPIDTKMVPTNTISLSKTVKIPKLESVLSTDSDDSDVKYSFPKSEKTQKSASKDSQTKEPVNKPQRKSSSDKRKSLSSIAKRKSLGKIGRPKLKPSSPVKQVRKRTTEVEHRCDCGQLFSSAALLCRHTSLAHTPPRIRRRRSPSPPPDKGTNTKPLTKTRPRHPTTITELTGSKKSGGNSDNSRSNVKTGSVKQNSSVKASDLRKSTKQDLKDKESEKASRVKPRRNAAHRVVPVPDKVRKVTEKMKL